MNKPIVKVSNISDLFDAFKKLDIDISDTPIYVEDELGRLSYIEGLIMFEATDKPCVFIKTTNIK